MSDKFVHIVSFDVPFPPDYGGVFDIYYRIKALHELGVKIKLHCFEYGRGIRDELKPYVHEVQYYRRRKSPLDSIRRLPFIVKSRDNRHLIRNLCKDDYPIFFEGLHTTYYLKDERLKGKEEICSCS